jgi:hypothetical protein
MRCSLHTITARDAIKVTRPLHLYTTIENLAIYEEILSQKNMI